MCALFNERRVGCLGRSIDLRRESDSRCSYSLSSLTPYSYGSRLSSFNHPKAPQRRLEFDDRMVNHLLNSELKISTVTDVVGFVSWRICNSSWSYYRGYPMASAHQTLRVFCCRRELAARQCAPIVWVGRIPTLLWCGCAEEYATGVSCATLRSQWLRWRPFHPRCSCAVSTTEIANERSI